jgi:hypothetical protein
LQFQVINKGTGEEVILIGVESREEIYERLFKMQGFTINGLDENGFDSKVEHFLRSTSKLHRDDTWYPEDETHTVPRQVADVVWPKGASGPSVHYRVNGSASVRRCSVEVWYGWAFSYRCRPRTGPPPAHAAPDWDPLVDAIGAVINNSSPLMREPAEPWGGVSFHTLLQMITGRLRFLPRGTKQHDLWPGTEGKLVQRLRSQEFIVRLAERQNIYYHLDKQSATFMRVPGTGRPMSRDQRGETT